MAQNFGEASSTVPSQARKQFSESLIEFAKQRGISIDFSSRVAGKIIDLYELYTYITGRGGYDAISGTKLGWRKVGLDFQLNPVNSAAYAFAMKTIYYKNLAAYEIKHLHGQEPPPVEILEDLTAKGGDLLNRTVDNFKVPARFQANENAGAESDSEDVKSPFDDRMDIDDANALSGRATRGLRQAPPQRVLFQPDLAPTRLRRPIDEPLQPTHLAISASSQAAYTHSSSNPASSTFSISNYEPRPQIPLTLRPILTPSSNFPLFQAQAKKLKQAKKAALGLAQAPASMKPGAGFEGPNIYVRLLNCIRCPIPEEQDYALHHMVKISHERGDKYKFDSFPGLAEGILEHLLKVGSLFYDIEWRISYFQDDNDPEVLDGINGTPDILDRIRSFPRIDAPDELESAEAAHRINKILEAGLTLRNLAMLAENAYYLSGMAQVKDLLCIVLNLPSTSSMIELKHYILDITEQVCQFWRLSESDPLYLSLLRVVAEEEDRGAIISALRALCRISMMLDEHNSLPSVPTAALQRMMDWIMLDDEEFAGACLDFLYQYTAMPDNVLLLLANSVSLPLVAMTSQLSRLLLHNASTTIQKYTIVRAISPEAATDIPSVPKDLMDQILRHDEPERSKLWLRAVFEEDSESHITQIALWQAYQQRFLDHSRQAALLQAADFIKNVSTVFQSANAQVITVPVQKFIIKGIRPRHHPMDTKGRVYSRCLWCNTNSQPCQEHHIKPRNMFEHLIHDHLKMARGEDQKWTLGSAKGLSGQDCYWSGCRHFARRRSPPLSAQELVLHVKTHLPDVSTKSAFRQRHNRTPANQVVPVRLIEGDIRAEFEPDVDASRGREATSKQIFTSATPVDEYGAPLGLPMTSVLVLRNLARNIPKALALSDSNDHEAASVKAMDRLFSPIRERLLNVIGANRPLAHLVTDLLARIDHVLDPQPEE